MKQLYKEPPRDKPKYALLKTTKLYLSWIRSNLFFFLQVIFAGLLLGFLTGIVLSEASNQISGLLSSFLSSLLSHAIQLGIITMFIYRYKQAKKMSLTFLARVFSIIIILTIYTILVAALRFLEGSRISRGLQPILLFLGNVICTIAIYNIVSCKTRLGLKSSLSWVADNILFYAKFLVLYLPLLIGLLLATGAVIQYILLDQNQARYAGIIIGGVIRSVLLPPSYFYIDGKQSEYAKSG